MTLLKEIELNGKEFEIHHFLGVVVNEKKWSETAVSGGGGGGHGGHSRTAPVVSKTTRHDQFILQNYEGKEKSFEFSDINLACREGNTLSVVWGIKKGKNEGPYWWVYNHNSEELFPTKAYSKIFEPPFWMKTLAFLSGLVVSGIFGLAWYMYIIFSVLGVIGHRFFYYGPQGNISVKKFKETDEFDTILQLLDSKAKKISTKEAENPTDAISHSQPQDH
ncbi:MAG: hypothetical protein KUG72_10105 [Pseudomonadales bacterium]|nr:hypothetical protein [Pseudomonadales bacterium]